MLQSAGTCIPDIESFVKNVCLVLYDINLEGQKLSQLSAFLFQVILTKLQEWICMNFHVICIICTSELCSEALNAAAILWIKDPQIFVEKFLLLWVGVYTDNSGEFHSQIFCDMAESIIKKWLKVLLFQWN